MSNYQFLTLSSSKFNRKFFKELSIDVIELKYCANLQQIFQKYKIIFYTIYESISFCVEILIVAKP